MQLHLIRHPRPAVAPGICYGQTDLGLAECPATVAERLPPLPESVVVVAHGGPLRAIAGHLLGMPPERWIGLDFGCGQVTRIDVERWGVVLKWFNR